MGLYIDRQDKVEWLSEHAVTVHTNEDVSEAIFTAADSDGLALLCLMDNGLFTALGIATDMHEFKRFAAHDGRPKMWFTVPKEKVLEEVPYIRKYGVFK